MPPLLGLVDAKFDSFAPPLSANYSYDTDTKDGREPGARGKRGTASRTFLTRIYDACNMYIQERECVRWQ